MRFRVHVERIYEIEASSREEAERFAADVDGLNPDPIKDERIVYLDTEVWTEDL